ncbi:MAG: hypothetical protein A2X36_08075 [Elusimicrobia bacterium GWA2_69_24]|nr:MAG: hypothetical protein A2X36_08075 [Elusimicrobia bacterium GWA2_69_24]
MRILLLPGNNSLSHVAKALALDRAFRARGHETRVAVSRSRSGFLDRLGLPHVVAPDIQETDQASRPTTGWFHRGAVAACVRAERELIREFRPDRVLGVFRFTAKAAAALEGVPFDSLACGCMLEECPDVLGFVLGDAGRAAEAAVLDDFWRFAGARLSAALGPAGFGPVRDARAMLRGERTFLWDTPQFQTMLPFPGARHVGPIAWDRWPEAGETGAEPAPSGGPCASRKSGVGAGPRRIRAGGRPLAVVTFGTCAGSPAAAERFARVLTGMGWRVVVAAGGQAGLEGLRLPEGAEPRGFIAMGRLLADAALVVCHGGQMTVFEALLRAVPVLVMPFQPEQAQNGLCLERIGCGRRLLPPVHFLGDSSGYLAALDALSDEDIRRAVGLLTMDPGVRSALARMREDLARYRGADAVADLLDSAPCSPA